MTHPNRKPQSPVPARPAVGVALLTTAKARADGISNPLWIIAIGMACFFGAAAVVMALG
jgi:hypothetical protein